MQCKQSSDVMWPSNFDFMSYSMVCFNQTSVEY